MADEDYEFQTNKLQRCGVPITIFTRTRLQTLSTAWGASILANDTTLTAMRQIIPWRTKPNKDEWWAEFFGYVRVDRASLDAPPDSSDAPDLESYGAIDLAAREAAAWLDLEAWHRKVLDEVERQKPTLPDAGLGPNPWEKWLKLVTVGDDSSETFWAKDNNRANDKDGNFWYGQLSGQNWVAWRPTINAPGSRIYWYFKDKGGITPNSSQVYDRIRQNRNFWQQFYNRVRNETQAVGNGSSGDPVVKDFREIGYAKGNKYLNEKPLWWQSFDEIYGGSDMVGGKATMRVNGTEGPKFNTTNVVAEGGEGTTTPAVPGTDVPGGTTAPPPAEDVYRGPGHNLPILYTNNTAHYKGSGAYYSTIPHTQDWRGGTGAGRDDPYSFYNPIKLARGFLRGPFGAGLTNAKYKDGSSVNQGGHIFYFHYNPNSIDFSFIYSTENTTPEQQAPETMVGTIKGWVLSFALLLDRSMEVNSSVHRSKVEDLHSSYQDALYQADLASETTDFLNSGTVSPNSPFFPEAPKTNWDPAPENSGLHYGILHDLAVLRSVFMMSESGRGAGAAFMAYFGPNLIVQGHPTNTNVNYTHFTQYMIPTRAVVNISMQMITPEQSNSGADSSTTVPAIDPATGAAPAVVPDATDTSGGGGGGGTTTPAAAPAAPAAAWQGAYGSKKTTTPVQQQQQPKYRWDQKKGGYVPV